jgi:hypothetical protein
MPFAQHDSLRHASEAGCLKKSFDHLVSGGLVEGGALRNCLRRRRCFSASYLIHASQALASKGRLSQSMRILEMASADVAKKTDFIVEKARRFYEIGRVEDAAVTLDLVSPREGPCADGEELVKQTWRRLNSFIDLENADKDFPHHDAAWKEIADFLLRHSQSGEHVLAPLEFSQVLADRSVEAPSAYTPLNMHDWVVTHKGNLRGFSPAFLQALSQLMVPAFADAVFVVWSADPQKANIEPFDSNHLNAFYRASIKFQARLADKEADLADSPQERDTYWVELREFVEDHIPHDDEVLSSSTCSRFLQKWAGVVCNEPSGWKELSRSPRWMIIHKGNIREFQIEVMSYFLSSMRPVFANAVFVVFACEPPETMMDLSESIHVKALFRGMRILLDEKSGAEKT